VAAQGRGLESGCVSFVGLCFAEVGSRFDATGSPYLYTRAAFGRFVAFEMGWMQWFTRVTGQASVVNAIALALGFYWPLALFIVVGFWLGHHAPPSMCVSECSVARLTAPASSRRLQATRCRRSSDERRTRNSCSPRPTGLSK
jgi:hypothetical protein